MKRKIALLSVWAGATLLTGAVAWGVVRLAGGSVTDEALQPLSASQVAALDTTTAASATTAVPAASTATTVTVTTTGSGAVPATVGTSIPVATGPGGETTTTQGTTATTAPPPGSTTTATTTTTAATTATTTPSQTKAFTLAAGSVVVRYDGRSVTVVSASPAPGYRVEVKAAGPPEVEVEFEGEERDAKFTARIEDGRLVTAIETGDDD